MDWGDDWFLKYPISHRGLHGEPGIPENSLLAFNRSIENKYPIELDVHLSFDGHVVVFHDESLDRMTGVNKNLSDLSLNELKELKLSGTEEKIPTLLEVLSFVDSQVPLVIELKCLEHTGELEEKVLDVLKNYDGAYCIQSFNPYTLLWFKKYAPEIPLGFITGRYDVSNISFWKKLVLKSLVFYHFIKPRYLAFESNYMGSKALSLLRRHPNVHIVAWTIRSQEEYLEIKSSCSNIIFEGFIPQP